MKGTTHVVIGLAVYATVVKAGLLPGHPAFYLAPLVGSLLPDIDHGGSYITKIIGLPVTLPFSSGKKIFLNPLYWPFLYTQHRGPTHSIVAVSTLGVVSLILTAILWTRLPVGACIGVVLGYASHIAADMLTVEGVELFWPEKRNYGVAKLKTGGTGEAVIFDVVVVWLIVLFAGNLLALLRPFGRFLGYYTFY
jgi:inner membrane protein